MAYSFLPSETISFNGRTTIADGDALNSGVLLPLSSRDSTILKDCNETYPYIDSVNNTVKTHSASWQNSAISGFSGLTVISTSTHDTWNIAGGQSFSKVLSFTSPQSEYFKCALQNNAVVFSAKDTLNDTSFSSYYKLWWYGINKQSNHVSLIDSVALRFVSPTDVVSDHSFAAFTYKNDFTDNNISTSSISIPIDEKTELRYDTSNCSINLGISEACTNSSVNFPVISHYTTTNGGEGGFYTPPEAGLHEITFPAMTLTVGGTNKVDYPERQYIQLSVEIRVIDDSTGRAPTSVPYAYLTVELPEGKKLYYDDQETGERVEVSYNNTQIGMTYHSGSFIISQTAITNAQYVYTLLGKGAQNYDIKMKLALPDGYSFHTAQGSYHAKTWTQYIACINATNKSVLLFGGGSADNCSVAVDYSVAGASSMALYNSDAELYSIATHYSKAASASIAAMTSYACDFSNAYGLGTAYASSYVHFYAYASANSIASFVSTAQKDSIAFFASTASAQSIAIKGSRCAGGAHSLALINSTAQDAGYNIAMCNSTAQSNGYNIALVNSVAEYSPSSIALVNSTAQDTSIALVSSFSKYLSFAAACSYASGSVTGGIALVKSYTRDGAYYGISVCNSTAEDGAASACALVQSRIEDSAPQSIAICNSLNGYSNSGGFACVDSSARSNYGYTDAFIGSTAIGGGTSLSVFESNTTASTNTVAFHHVMTTPEDGVLYWNNFKITSGGSINGVNLQLVKMHIAPSTLESDKVYITEV